MPELGERHRIVDGQATRVQGDQLHSKEFGTSSATVRSQLGAAMSKAGVGWQAELVRLLSGGALPAL